MPIRTEPGARNASSPGILFVVKRERARSGVRADEEIALTLAVRPVVGQRAKITALGTHVPPQVLTNKDLEKMVETNDQWIVDRKSVV